MSHYEFTIDKNNYQVEVKCITGPLATVMVNNKQYLVTIKNNGFSVEPENPTSFVQATPSSKPKAIPTNGEQRTIAAMPGLVLKIPVTEGQKVSAGDTVLILEAMKMENNLIASSDGVVSKILVEEGQEVTDNAVLIEYT